jgi:hypothetical protein
MCHVLSALRNDEMLVLDTTAKQTGAFFTTRNLQLLYSMAGACAAIFQPTIETIRSLRPVSLLTNEKN